jgi:hypothetical protein
MAAVLLATAAMECGAFAAPAPLSAEQTDFLESARLSALQYTQKLPDFICTQITHREVLSINGYASPITGRGISGFGPDTLVSSDEIQERLTYFNQREKYGVIAINGRKVVGMRHMDIAGAISAGEFGSVLRDIFAPKSHTVFFWDRVAKLRGRRVWVFAFEVPAEAGAQVYDQLAGQQIVAAYGGQIFVDESSRDILRIVSKVHLPPGFHIKAANRSVDYRAASIAGKEFNLPFHSEVRITDGGLLYDNKIDFKNYHRFAVESTIHYGNEKKQ